MRNVCEGEKAFLHGCRNLYVVFASELQSAEAHSIAWIAIMSDIDNLSLRLSYKEIRIFVTPFQMTLQNRICQDIHPMV